MRGNGSLNIHKPLLVQHRLVSLGRAEVMLEEGVKEKVVCSGLYETSNRCWKVKSNYRKREESHF